MCLLRGHMEHMSRASAFVASLAGLALLAGCAIGGGPGPERTQARSVPDVASVELETGGQLDVTTGTEPSLTVTAGERVLDGLTSEVEGGRLTLAAKPGARRLGAVRYKLVVRRLEALQVAGSGDATASVDSPARLQLGVAGSGSIDLLDVRTEDLVVRVSGSGEVRASGEARHQTVDLLGSGVYEGRGLVSETGGVSVSGSGQVFVNVTGSLDAQVSGSGSVHHSGGATVRSRVTGSGEVVGD